MGDGMQRNGEQSVRINDLAVQIMESKETWLSGQIKERLPAKVFEQVTTNPGLAKHLLEELNIHIREYPDRSELWQDKVMLSVFRIVTRKP